MACTAGSHSTQTLQRLQSWIMTVRSNYTTNSTPLCHSLPLGVEVGLNTTYQMVRENESPALVCAVVDSPDETNPSSV